MWSALRSLQTPTRSLPYTRQGQGGTPFLVRLTVSTGLQKVGLAGLCESPSIPLPVSSDKNNTNRRNTLSEEAIIMISVLRTRKLRHIETKPQLVVQPGFR